MLGNADEISLIFLRILGPPNHSVLWGPACSWQKKVNLYPCIQFQDMLMDKDGHDDGRRRS